MNYKNLWYLSHSNCFYCKYHLQILNTNKVQVTSFGHSNWASWVLVCKLNIQVLDRWFESTVCLKWFETQLALILIPSSLGFNSVGSFWFYSIFCFTLLAARFSRSLTSSPLRRVLPKAKPSDQLIAQLIIWSIIHFKQKRYWDKTVFLHANSSDDYFFVCINEMIACDECLCWWLS